MPDYKCTQCGEEMSFSDKAVGKRAKCRKCGDLFRVPKEPPPLKAEVLPYTPPPQPAPQSQPQRPQRPVYHCPYCGTTRPPLDRSKVAPIGYVFAIVLLLFMCLPLFWIGLMIKENYRVCPSCGMKLS